MVGVSEIHSCEKGVNTSARVFQYVAARKSKIDARVTQKQRIM